MRIHRAVPAIASAIVAAGCGLPNRDNENDPSVRPRAAFEVRIGGIAGVTASRSAEWQLDCSTSEDGGRIDRCEWFLSDAPGADQEPGAVTWIPIGEAELLEAETASAFRDALRAIGDFASTDPGAPLDGTGIVRRWIRLVVTDDDGIEDDEVRPILVTNARPAIHLGGDRRLAAGGIPWTGAEIGESTPFTLTLELAVTDPDGDPTGAPEWRVSGDLAQRLDLDGDGAIDDAFIPDVDRRRAIFDAPLFPARGSIEARVSDVTLPGGAVGGTAIDEISVEVGSQMWMYDAGIGELRRLEPPPEAFDASFLRIIASDGERLLKRRIGADPDASGYQVVDHLGRRVIESYPPFHSELALEAFGEPFEPQGAADGAGGWWILATDDPDGGGSEPPRGIVCHLANAVSTCFEDPDDDMDPDFQADEGTLSAASGTTDVWVVAGETAAPRTRLYRMTASGTVSLDIAAVAGATAGTVVGLVTATSGNAAWTVLDGPGNDDRLRLFDASGAVAHDEAIPTTCGGVIATKPQALTLAPRSGRMFLTLTGGRLCERFADGSWLSAVVPAYGAAEAVPTSDGRHVRLVRTDGSTSLRLLTYEADTLSLVSLRNLPAGGDAPGGGNLFAVGDRGVAGIMRWGGAISNFIFVEEQAGIEPRFAPTVSPARFAEVDFEIDPSSGSLFVWNPETALVETRLPDGTLAREDAIGASSASTVRLALDPIARVLWVAWTQGAAGMLERWELGVSAFDAPSITNATALGSVLRDVVVVPADGARPPRVFVTGTFDGGSSPAFVFDDDTQTASDLPGIDIAADVLARHADGVWILPRIPSAGTQGHRVDASLAVESFSAEVCPVQDAVVAPWDGVLRAVVSLPTLTPCPEYLVSFDPIVGTTGITPALVGGLVPPEMNGVRSHGSSIGIDTTHRRILVGFDHLAASANGGQDGALVWIDREHRETRFVDDLLYPRF